MSLLARRRTSVSSWRFTRHMHLAPATMPALFAIIFELALGALVDDTHTQIEIRDISFRPISLQPRAFAGGGGHFSIAYLTLQTLRDVQYDPRKCICISFRVRGKIRGNDETRVIRAEPGIQRKISQARPISLRCPSRSSSVVCNH